MGRITTFLIGICLAAANAQADSPSLFDFSLPSLQENRTVPLEQYRGKVMLMSFFEPDCGWCYRQMKALNRLVESCPLHLQPVAVGIKGKAPELRQELRRAKFRYPAFAGTGKLLNAVGKVPATPWTLVTDGNGTILTTLRGYIPLEKLTQAFGDYCAG